MRFRSATLIKLIYGYAVGVYNTISHDCDRRRWRRHRDGNDDAGDDDADGYGDAAGSDEDVNDDVAGEWCHHQLHLELRVVSCLLCIIELNKNPKSRNINDNNGKM